MKYITLALILLCFLGILFIVIDIVRTITSDNYKSPKIIYRYIPRTFEEDELDPLYVSDIFDTMFSQPSPWVQSVMSYDRRRQEKINQYFISQM